jgi:hypothetical protein
MTIGVVEGVGLAKALLEASIELGKMAYDFFSSGKKPDPKRVREVWARLEQETAKAETDAAERERWPGEG